MSLPSQPASAENSTSSHASSFCLVLDIGKTNVKLHVLDSEGESVFGKSMANKVIPDYIYPHADVMSIWIWMGSALKELTSKYFINAISITTHGATAALVDRNAPSSNDGLVLPVLDYEFTGVEAISEEYGAIRPGFYETYSPDLPAGLNLGRQLYWQQKNYPEEFSKVTDILCYPQYWAWRLTGSLYSEVTSLGCHTDLWNPQNQAYSSLVNGRGWANLFPQIIPAWGEVGRITETVSQQTGLPESCIVYAGVHDSNASFLRYKLRQSGKPFAVISTGTWTILMASGVPVGNLDPLQDMLANVDVTGMPVACARFMGGREFEGICERLGGQFGDSFNVKLLQDLIDADVMALPDFSEGSGPFGGREPGFTHAQSDVLNSSGAGAAVATLYCAMMMDYQLDKLGANGDIYIEGAFLQNPLMCGILAALRPSQTVWLSADATGTVQGCASLTRWEGEHKDFSLDAPPTVCLDRLNDYKRRWLTMLGVL